MNNETQKQNIKTLVRGAYDIQKLRIQMGNRIVANFKSQLGISPGEVEQDVLDLKGKQILKDLLADYDKIADAIVANYNKVDFKGCLLISNLAEAALVSGYKELVANEAANFKWLAYIVQQHPLWKAFLKDVRGVGPTIAGVIMSEFDIHRAKYPSSLIMYCGLDVAPDGRGRGKYSEHLIDVEYKARNGQIKTKKSITFNPFLKTKMIGILAPSFLKSKNEKYSTIYYNYKTRYENHPKHKDKSKKHRHNMAIRKMISIFLIDLHVAWRTLEGLEVSVPYHEAKLGLKHVA